MTVAAEDRELRVAQRRARAAARRRRRFLVRRLVALGLVLVLVGVVLGVLLLPGGQSARVGATHMAKVVAQVQVGQLDTSAPYALPAPVERALALPVGGRIIIAGGLSGGRSASGVFAFDPASGHLSSLGSVPQAFHDAAGAVLGGLALVCWHTHPSDKGKPHKKPLLSNWK